MATMCILSVITSPNLWFRFTAAVTAKAVIYKLLNRLFYVVCLEWFVLVSQTNCQSFLPLTEKDCYERTRLCLFFQP